MEALTSRILQTETEGDLFRCSPGLSSGTVWNTVLRPGLLMPTENGIENRSRGGIAVTEGAKKRRHVLRGQKFWITPAPFSDRVPGGKNFKSAPRKTGWPLPPVELIGANATPPYLARAYNRAA
jgi:hypothetical protein